MDQAGAREHLSQSLVARLATVGADGRPHIVPICYVLFEDNIYFAVDHKPKRTADLQRLRNIAANPSVAVLVDHYDDDWRRLWWVRADGEARIVEAADESQRAITLLKTRYQQYAQDPPEGPVVTIQIERVRGWSAS